MLKPCESTDVLLRHVAAWQSCPTGNSMDGQIGDDIDMSTKVNIKTEKGEVPVKYCYKNDQNMEKENASITDSDKTMLHADLLEQCQQELNTVKEELVKTERRLEKANAYNEDLRGEMDKLSSELHRLKSAAREKVHAETQTDDHQDNSTERDGLSTDQAIVIDDSINEGHDHEDKTDGGAKMTEDAKTLDSANTDDGKKTDKDAIAEESTTTENASKPEDDKMEHDAKIEKEAKAEEEKVSSTSLADELRATAEAAVQQTGYVYDENSGLYYDYNSGYYYNAEKALYYDPNTGTYFYYNSETGKYDFHSQVDLSQYSTGQDSQQYNNVYGQVHHQDTYPSTRGRNYDQHRGDYHTSHRHDDSGYDQYHRPLPRRDRETSRSSKSYVEHDRHTSSQRRDKEGSSSRGTESGKKKESKRLQSEEIECHKRKKKKKDKEKKKKKKKSSKEKRGDDSSEKKSEKKRSDDGKRKIKERREQYEDGEVRSEDSKERDDDSKEGDEDNKENNNDEDMESYDLEGKSYLGELYENFDENSNNEVSSEEASTMDDLYDDLMDDKIVQQSESGDDALSKSTGDYLKPEDHKHSLNNPVNMENSPTNMDDIKPTHRKKTDSSKHHSDDINIYTTHSKKTQYSKRKKTHSSKDSSSSKDSFCNNIGKLRKKKSSSKDLDSDTGHKKKSQRYEKESSDVDTTHKKKASISNKHQTKTSKSGSSHKHGSSRHNNYTESSDRHSSKHHIKSRETSGEKQGIDFSETSGKSHSYKLSKQGRKSTLSRREGVRKTKMKSRKQRAFSSDSDSDSKSSNSLCTGESELESGEITSSSEEEAGAMQRDDNEDVQEVFGEGHSNDVIMAEEELVRKWPPCIRVIVTDSDTIDPGMLFIITCTGATVGREKEKGHTILIPDINVSKAHAEIHFDEQEYQYYLTDLASQNGTFLNEERVAEPKVKSKPKVLSHGDTLQFGCTRLLLHIHDGLDTCDECEPGQVQAQIQVQNQPQKEIVILSKEEKLKQQRQQLKRIKKKYGLKNSAYVDNMSAINNPGYSDKAEERRKTVGSDNPYQADEAPASVHRPISEGNKGHKMLKKLGWTEGDSLGKDNEGIRQPISVKFRANKSAGLGAGGGGEGSVEEVGDLHRRQKWLDVQRRYNKTEESAGTGSGRDKKTLSTPKWVQGETQEG